MTKEITITLDDCLKMALAFETHTEESKLNQTLADQSYEQNKIADGDYFILQSIRSDELAKKCISKLTKSLQKYFNEESWNKAVSEELDLCSDSWQWTEII